MIYAVYISKGGTGKSTSAINLAALSALEGSKTLLWDLDPQGSASYVLSPESGLEHSAKKLLSGQKDWIKEVQSTRIPGLSLIPGDSSLRNWDILLENEKGSKKLLGSWLKPLKDNFETIILDCPPGLSLLSENLFRAADCILAPILVSDLGLRALEQIQNFIQTDSKINPPVLPFLSLVDRRKKNHRLLAENPPKGFLRSYIPLLGEIESLHPHKTLAVCSAKTQSRALYEKLWSEIRDSAEAAKSSKA